MNKPILIFVYNANSDLFSTVTDFTHKLLSPSTYQCHLCALSYGNFSVKQRWKSFIESLLIESVFLHKNEFEKKWRIPTKLPVVFISINGTLQKLITEQQINSCQTLDEMENLVSQKLKDHVQHHNSDI